MAEPPSNGELFQVTIAPWEDTSITVGFSQGASGTVHFGLRVASTPEISKSCETYIYILQ